MRRYEFFGRLARAVNRHHAAHGPSTQRATLSAMLDEIDAMLDEPGDGATAAEASPPCA